MPKFQPVICCRNESANEGQFSDHLSIFLEAVCAKDDCAPPIVVSNDPAFEYSGTIHVALSGSGFLEQMAAGQEAAERLAPYDNVVMIDFINMSDDALLDEIVRKAAPGIHRGYVVLLRKKTINAGKPTFTIGELTNVDVVDPFSFEGVIVFTHETMREHIFSARHSREKKALEHLFLPIQGITHQCLAA